MRFVVLIEDHLLLVLCLLFLVRMCGWEQVCILKSLHLGFNQKMEKNLTNFEIKKQLHNIKKGGSKASYIIYDDIYGVNDDHMIVHTMMIRLIMLFLRSRL